MTRRGSAPPGTSPDSVGVVSEVSEGGFGGWRPQTIAECGPAFAQGYGAARYQATDYESQFAAGRQIRGPAVVRWAMARQADDGGRRTGMAHENVNSPRLNSVILPYCTNA